MVGRFSNPPLSLTMTSTHLTCRLSWLAVGAFAVAASRLPAASTTRLDDLHGAILDDILVAYVGHEPSECGATAFDDSSSTSFSFEFPGTDDSSDWFPDFIPYEEKLFRAHMQFTDPSGDKSWSIRVGTGGNIYSYIAHDKWGETLPPQRHGSKADSPWVDEVYQSVSVNRKLNQINQKYDYPQYCSGDPTLPPSSPDHGTCTKMYIHQAGAYQRDAPFTDDEPFFAPSLAARCVGATCSFAGWGVSAHVATPFTSSVIYINRYTDCGDGIMEHTQMIHNFADPNSFASLFDGGRNVNFDFFNIPWAGVRSSRLPFVLEPEDEMDDTLSYELTEGPIDYLNLCTWGGNNIHGDRGHDKTPTGEPAWRGASRDLKDIGGFTTFVANGLLVNRTVTDVTTPCRDNSVDCFVDSSNCMVPSCTNEQVESGSHTRIQLKVAANSSPNCVQSGDPFSSSYNDFVVVKCEMHDKGFGRDRKGYRSTDAFVCAPWVYMAFVNTRTGKILDVPYVRHWSWNPNKMDVFFAIKETDAQTAIEKVNNMFDNTGFSSELMIDVRTINGNVYASDIPTDYSPGALGAFTCVYGSGEEFDGPDSIGGRIQRRVGSTESGPSTRDYTVFTVRWFSGSLEPGSTFAIRNYNIVGDLKDVKETADSLSPQTFSAKIDAELWSPRVVDVYQDGAYMSIVASSIPRGNSTSCGNMTRVCSGSSTPSPGHVPYFYATCGDSTHFGLDPYAFTPTFGNGDPFPWHGTYEKPVRAYLCDGMESEVRPTWKLMGFFPPGDAGCSSLPTLTYDETVFACPDQLAPSLNFTDPPSSEPTAVPTAMPTPFPTPMSPTHNPAKSNSKSAKTNHSKTNKAGKFSGKAESPGSAKSAKAKAEHGKELMISLNRVREHKHADANQ